MFNIEAFAVLKIKKFTIVNDCFQNKNNDDSEHYVQTLISKKVNYITECTCCSFVEFGITALCA